MINNEDLNGLEIFLWYPCNQKCIFCFQKDLRLKDSSFLKHSDVISIINNWFDNWKRSIVFSWWESTLDINLFEYIKYCKNKWFENIKVHSNWLFFSNIEKLKNYYNAWMNGVIISIHWYGIVHDKIVLLDWAFELIKKTFLNLTEIKKVDNTFIIDTNTVLTKLNYKNLYVLFRFLSYFPITRSQIVQLYSLYLFSTNEKRWLYVSYEEFSTEIEKIVKTGKNITLENFPLCKINKKYWNLVIERKKYNNDAYWNMWEWFQESDCTYIDICSTCTLKKQCSWIPKDYLDVFNF